MLQPLNQYDGWAEGSKRGEWVKRKAEKWLPLCSKLRVEQLQVGRPVGYIYRPEGLLIVQVGSNDYAEANATDDVTAAGLSWLAELGAQQDPPVKIAYESWTFGSRALNWEKTWHLVQLAVRRHLSCGTVTYR